ncbi:MAG: Holliday junction branch migration protein RuvA [Chitinophagales bacterium]|nr:Holliday junction branch migration protein RuvA [Chitinophagales bacterium]
MIAYINGTITFKSPVYLLIETGGIGYQVFISLNTFSAVPDKGPCRLLTHLHVTDSSHTLYGFADELEKSLFGLLITVSGIGPSTARMALSSLSPAELQKAILHENLPLIQGIKGIGPKSAKRIVLELKDKVIKTADENLQTISAPSNNSIREEALSALVALGFNKSAAEKAVQKAISSGEQIANVESLIKQSLKSL